MRSRWSKRAKPAAGASSSTCELDFVDSSGLRFLLGCYAESRRNGFTTALIPGPRPVQRLFELTGTVDHLPFTDP